MPDRPSEFNRKGRPPGVPFLLNFLPSKRSEMGKTNYSVVRGPAAHTSIPAGRFCRLPAFFIFRRKTVFASGKAFSCVFFMGLL